eukprot:2915296-Prymnesium_polylepis.1
MRLHCTSNVGAAPRVRARGAFLLTSVHHQFISRIAPQQLAGTSCALHPRPADVYRAKVYHCASPSTSGTSGRKKGRWGGDSAGA